MSLSVFSTGNLLTIAALIGSFAVFLMRYEGRISKIESLALEQQHRIERTELLIRDMYPKLEKVNNNLEWLVQQRKDEMK